jgi:tRNA nucleotidyltransferase (CCA-adding enzyme)
MGADMKILSAFIKPAYSRKQKDLFFRMLETAKRTKLNGSQVAIIPAKVDGHIDNLAMVIQMVLQILNLDAAFGIFSISEKRCLVIGRSITDSINIGTIMRCIGGGGHSGAGSAMTKSINRGVLEDWIRILISGKGNTADHVGQLMSAPVFTVSPETTMEAAVTAFRNRAFHGAPVVENGHADHCSKQSVIHNTVKQYRYFYAAWVT